MYELLDSFSVCVCVVWGISVFDVCVCVIERVYVGVSVFVFAEFLMWLTVANIIWASSSTDLNIYCSLFFKIDFLLKVGYFNEQ